MHSYGSPLDGRGIEPPALPKHPPPPPILGCCLGILVLMIRLLLCRSLIIFRAGGTRVALVTFGTEASLEFNLGDAKTRTENGTLAAIDEVQYRGGGTATAMALKMVDENVAPSARKDSHKVIMFITDGMSNIGGSPLGIAKKLRDRKKFTIYTIGKILIQIFSLGILLPAMVLCSGPLRQVKIYQLPIKS